MPVHFPEEPHSRVDEARLNENPRYIEGQSSLVRVVIAELLRRRVQNLTPEMIERLVTDDEVERALRFIMKRQNNEGHKKLTDAQELILQALEEGVEKPHENVRSFDSFGFSPSAQEYAERFNTVEDLWSHVESVLSGGLSVLSIEFIEIHHKLTKYVGGGDPLPPLPDLEKQLWKLQPISELHLSVRARKGMIRLGIETIGEATKYSADDFLDLMGFGKITLAEVCSKLSCLGLQLRESASREQPISLNLREKRKVIQDWRKGLLRMCRLNNACRAKPDDEQLHEEARQAREDFGEMSHMLFRCAGPGTGDALPIGDLENIGIQVGVGRLLNWVEVCPGGGDLESLAQIIRRRVNRAVEGTEALQTHPLDINTTTSASPRSLEGREIKLREQIERVLRTISYRERQILGLRLGLKDGYPYTLEDVGNIFETTRERIRQIEAKAIRKLHHGIRKNDLPVAAGLI